MVEAVCLRHLRFGSTRFESEPYDEDVIPGFWHLQRYRKS